MAANLLGKMKAEAGESYNVDNLVTMNTPAREEYQLEGGSIDNFVNVYTMKDDVQLYGEIDFNRSGSLIPVSGGLAGRRQQGAMNINMQSDLVPDDPFASHSSMHSNPQIIKILRGFFKTNE